MESYYDISYHKGKNGPLEYVQRADWSGVVDWLRDNGGQIDSILILRLDGNPRKCDQDESSI